MQQASPDPHPALRMTLRQAFDAYYRSDLEATARPATITKYRACLTCWERRTPDPEVGRIDNDCLASFRDVCQRDDLAPMTFNRVWTHLRSVLRRLGPNDSGNPQGMDILTRVPYVRLLRVELAFPRIATVEEIDRLYAACEKARLPRTCVPAPEYWRAAIVVLWNCGPRASDVFLLRPEEIDFEKRQLRFTARKSKRLQAIPLNETTIAHLRAIWSSRQFMFPLPKSVLEGSNGARGEWKRLQQIAGITPPLTFQALRKTCASLYTEHFGRDVASYLLGHAVPGVTATWYSNPTRQIVHAVNNLPQPESFKTAKTFCVWRPSRRTDFLFQPGSVCYRDRLIRLPPKPLAILQALVAAGRPLTTDELKRAAFWNDPGIRDRAIFRGLRQLRAGLAKALRLPEGWDPVRSDRFGSGGWILILPTAQGDAE